MIGDPPVLTLRQNFERPTAAQVAAFEGVPTGFVVDAQMGQGAVDQRIKPLRDDIEDWLRKVEPYAAQLGYSDYLHTLRQILERGNSATRQRAIFAKTGSLDEVVKFNMREFKAAAPLWDEATLSKPTAAQIAAPEAPRPATV